jgi:hypothetical protein
MRQSSVLKTRSSIRWIESALNSHPWLVYSDKYGALYSSILAAKDKHAIDSNRAAHGFSF